MRNAVEMEKLAEVIIFRSGDIITCFSFQMLFDILFVSSCRRFSFSGDINKLELREKYYLLTFGPLAAGLAVAE